MYLLNLFKERELSSWLHVSHNINSSAGEKKASRSKWKYNQMNFCSMCMF